MFEEIAVQRISAGTLFKLTVVGIGFSFIPFSVLMGVLALFGAATISVNHQPLTGLAGLLASPFVGLGLTVVFTLFVGTFMMLGLWLYSTIRPLTLLVKIPDEDATSGSDSAPARQADVST